MLNNTGERLDIKLENIIKALKYSAHGYDEICTNALKIRSVFY
jgi:hypothetical protein